MEPLHLNESIRYRWDDSGMAALQMANVNVVRDTSADTCTGAGILSAHTLMVVNGSQCFPQWAVATWALELGKY